MKTKTRQPTRTEAEAPGRWEFTIPDWRPAALNELLGCHWAKANRLKRRDKEYVWGYARQAFVPRATGKRRVSLRITLPKGQRRWDIDALQKSLLDALVGARLLVDDSPKWAEWGGVEYLRGDQLSTTIIVEDIPYHFACNRCDFAREAGSHPCPKCRCPEFRIEHEEATP